VVWRRLQNAAVVDPTRRHGPPLGIPVDARSGPKRETPPSHEREIILERELCTRRDTNYDSQNDDNTNNDNDEDDTSDRVKQSCASSRTQGRRRRQLAK
jgi:hypothetical protein